MKSHLRKAHPNKTPNAGLHATEQARKKKPAPKSQCWIANGTEHTNSESPLKKKFFFFS